MFPSVGCANTQIQLHKYTNTVWVKFADKPNMCYIFEKVMVRGPQKQYSPVSDMQIYKYTNTVWVKFADRSNMCYIFKRSWYIRGPQKQCSRLSDQQLTNTQIKFGLKVMHRR